MHLVREITSTIVTPQRETAGTSRIQGVRGEPQGLAKPHSALNTIGAHLVKA